MKKTHLILFLLFSYYSFILGTRDCFPQSQFQLVIGDSSNIGEVRSIIQTTDGGFIAVGETGTNGDLYIVKLNSSGQLQWSKTIGGSGQDLALSVVQTTDGGFVVSGFGNSFGAGVAGAFIVKLTSAGIVEWARVLADGFLDAAYSIVQTIDGGYAFAISPGEGGGYSRIIIVKLNSMGILQWSKDIVEGWWTYARCIRQTTDKGYVVAGATGSPDFEMFVVKLDSNGSLQWAKTIGGTDSEFAYSIVQTTDGGYAVAGRTASQTNGDQMYIVKLDSSGMLQWTKVVSVFLDRAYSIVQTTDGGYAVAGYTGGGDGMLIVKFNPDGSLQWSRVVNGGSVQTYAYSIIQTTDGGYAAAGYGGIAGTTGMYIVKLDINGNTCANTVSHNITIDSGGILGSPSPSVTNISLLDTLVTPPTGSLGYVTPICVIGIQPISNEIPASYKLYQNYPNPFNPVANIKFEIPNDVNVNIKIYDILGREVFSINEYKKAGSYEVQFDGSNFASGMYFYKMVVGDNTNNGDVFTDTKKMVLLK
jgi:hypothetical protein